MVRFLNGAPSSVYQRMTFTYSSVLGDRKPVHVLGSKDGITNGVR